MAKRKEDLLVVKSKVKEYAKRVGKGVRFPDDAVEALDKRVKELIQQAVKAAKAYGKKTVKGDAL